MVSGGLLGANESRKWVLKLSWLWRKKEDKLEGEWDRYLISLTLHVHHNIHGLDFKNITFRDNPSVHTGIYTELFVAICVTFLVITRISLVSIKDVLCLDLLYVYNILVIVSSYRQIARENVLQNAEWTVNSVKESKIFIWKIVYQTMI